MNVKDVKSEGLKREFVISIPFQEIQSKVDEELKKISKTAKLPGFRPGKIPLDFVKKKYGDNAQYDAIEKVAQENLVQVIKDKDINPAAQPDVKFSEYEKGKDLELTVSLEVMPEIKVPDYSKFQLKRFVSAPTNEDLKEELAFFEDMLSKTKPVEEERPIHEKDLLKVDMNRYFEGDKSKNLESKDTYIDMTNSLLPKEVEKQLIGKKVGDFISHEFTFPKEHENEKLAGKAVTYEIKINSILVKEQAKLDDEKAKELGFTDLAEIKEYLKKNLQERYDQDSFLCLKRSILDELAKDVDFDVPEVMAHSEFHSIWDQYQENIKKDGQKAPSEKEEAQLKKDLKNIAIRRVRLGLLLGKVGNDNNIKVPEKMVQQEMVKIAKRYPGQEKQIIEYYMKNQEAMASLRAPLFEDLVVQHIADKAQVKDISISPDELFVKADEVMQGLND